MQRDDHSITPSVSDSGVTTAPTLTAEEEIRELRNEVQRLRSLLQKNGEAQDRADWPQSIEYHQQPYVGARLAGITKNRESIRSTSDFEYLPKPTEDLGTLEYDFNRWGYCILSKALTTKQIESQSERLLDQAAAERAAGLAKMSHRGAAQTVFNLLPKGAVFRDLISLEANALSKASTIESLLEKILGQGFYLGTAHGSIVHQHGGRQELHQDQGFVPLPHPTYPVACLIIYTYTNFSLEEGATYVVPGSHRDASGNNLVTPTSPYEELAKNNLLALNAPAGCAILTDSRLLHSGGKRSAPGRRLASRILYLRGFMRQQENQLAGMTEEMLNSLSNKLKGLIGFKSHYGLGMVEGNSLDPTKPKIQIGELSMSRPEEFKQDFDWRYSKIAKHMSESDWESFVDYRGERD